MKLLIFHLKPTRTFSTSYKITAIAFSPFIPGRNIASKIGIYLEGGNMTQTEGFCIIMIFTIFSGTVGAVLH